MLKIDTLYALAIIYELKSLKDDIYSEKTEIWMVRVQYKKMLL